MNGTRRVGRIGRRIGGLRASFVVIVATCFLSRLEAASIIVYPEADNWISSCTSGSTVNNGGDTELRVRSAGLWGDVKDFRSLLRFDLAAVSVDTRRISQVTLNLYYYQYHWANPKERQYSVHRITTSWEEMQSSWQARDDHDTPDPLYWDSYLAGVPVWDPGGGDFDPPVYASAEVPDIGDGAGFDETWMTWKVTDLVLEWMNEVHPNEGLLLRDAEETEEYTEDVSWGPAQFRSADHAEEPLRPHLGVVCIGDYDSDGDVDLLDHAAFADCMCGPDQAPVPLEDCLEAFDSELDGDVDLRDFAAFQRAIGAIDP